MVSSELKLGAPAVVEAMADKRCWTFGKLPSTSLTAFDQWLPHVVIDVFQRRMAEIALGMGRPFPTKEKRYMRKGITGWF